MSMEEGVKESYRWPCSCMVGIFPGFFNKYSANTLIPCTRKTPEEG